jgi:hypothetical protein
MPRTREEFTLKAQENGYLEGLRTKEKEVMLTIWPGLLGHRAAEEWDLLERWLTGRLKSPGCNF